MSHDANREVISALQELSNLSGAEALAFRADIHPMAATSFLIHFEELSEAQENLDIKGEEIENLLNQLPAYLDEFIERLNSLQSNVQTLLRADEEMPDVLVAGFRETRKEYENLQELVRSYFPDEVARQKESD